MGTNGTRNNKPRTSSTIEMEYWFDPANKERLKVGAPRHTWKLCANGSDARFVAPVFILILGFFLHQTWFLHNFEPHKFWGTFGYLVLMGLLMRIAWRDRARLNRIRTNGVLAVGVITDCTLRETHDGVKVIICFELSPTASLRIRGCRHLSPISRVQPGAKVTALVLEDGQYALL